MDLKELRKKKKLSQAKLAEICGTSQTHYSGIEKGERRPSVDLANKIIATSALTTVVVHFILRYLFH